MSKEAAVIYCNAMHVFEKKNNLDFLSWYKFVNFKEELIRFALSVENAHSIVVYAPLPSPRQALLKFLFCVQCMLHDAK